MRGERSAAAALIGSVGRLRGRCGGPVRYTACARPGAVSAFVRLSTPLFNLVLLNPEIPNNTGNIGRTAMATGCRLHVVHPIGFDMSEKARRRAGLDYWHLVDCVEHESWESFVETEGFLLPSPAGRGVGGEGASEHRASLEDALTLPSPRGRG